MFSREVSLPFSATLFQGRGIFQTIWWGPRTFCLSIRDYSHQFSCEGSVHLGFFLDTLLSIPPVPWPFSWHRREQTLPNLACSFSPPKIQPSILPGILLKFSANALPEPVLGNPEPAQRPPNRSRRPGTNSQNPGTNPRNFGGGRGGEIPELASSEPHSWESQNRWPESRPLS